MVRHGHGCRAVLVCDGVELRQRRPEPDVVVPGIGLPRRLQGPVVVKRADQSGRLHQARAECLRAAGNRRDRVGSQFAGPVRVSVDPVERAQVEPERERGQQHRNVLPYRLRSLRVPRHLHQRRHRALVDRLHHDGVQRITAREVRELMREHGPQLVPGQPGQQRQPDRQYTAAHHAVEHLDLGLRDEERRLGVQDHGIRHPRVHGRTQWRDQVAEVALASEVDPDRRLKGRMRPHRADNPLHHRNHAQHDSAPQRNRDHNQPDRSMCFGHHHDNAVDQPAANRDHRHQRTDQHHIQPRHKKQRQERQKRRWFRNLGLGCGHCSLTACSAARSSSSSARSQASARVMGRSSIERIAAAPWWSSS